MRLLLAVLTSAAAVPTGFQTPSHNIACEAWHTNFNERGISCVVFSASPRSRGQKTWFMRMNGRAHVFVLGANVATDVPVLRYGRSWHWLSIGCTSRRNGLTCRNRSGHGWFLSRQRQRIF
ncbi:MAG: hypothetical protein M3R70_01595 [Actinomycetota bacterium]|nr:hypothetical protein [Actinomycetota bacterium]